MLDSLSFCLVNDAAPLQDARSMPPHRMTGEMHIFLVKIQTYLGWTACAPQRRQLSCECQLSIASGVAILEGALAQRRFLQPACACADRHQLRLNCRPIAICDSTASGVSHLAGAVRNFVEGPIATSCMHTA